MDEKVKSPAGQRREQLFDNKRNGYDRLYGFYQIFFPIFTILIKKISDFVVMRQDSAFPIKRVRVIL